MSIKKMHGQLIDQFELFREPRTLANDATSIDIAEASVGETAADKPVAEGVAGSARPMLISLYGEVDYLLAQHAMSDFTHSRDAQQRDQIWLLQHPPVYTLGTACQQSPLSDTQIPIVKSDRGGQITYHGPGQIVLYPLLNLRRHGLGVKSLVSKLEQSVIDLLATYEVFAERRVDAPGVYVQEKKIAALGLRIRRGSSYHGLSLNVDMDLAPFKNIDPCGYQGLQVTQLRDQLGLKPGALDIPSITQQLLKGFVSQL